MKRKWQHAALALALAGIAILVPCSAAAHPQHPAYTRRQRAQLRREVRQEKRQLRRQYAKAAGQKPTLRSDIRQAKQTAKATGSERNQQFHQHRSQVAHKQKKK